MLAYNRYLGYMLSSSEGKGSPADKCCHMQVPFSYAMTKYDEIFLRCNYAVEFVFPRDRVLWSPVEI